MDNNPLFIDIGLFVISHSPCKTLFHCCVFEELHLSHLSGVTVSFLLGMSVWVCVNEQSWYVSALLSITLSLHAQFKRLHLDSHQDLMVYHMEK